MIGDLQFKVCGLTRPGDAQAAAEIGADYLGFIFYPKSPRKIGLERYRDIRSQLPDRPKVAVTVAPDLRALAQLEAAGFDFFQIHYPAAGLSEEIEAWSKRVGKERLWLAPKVPPGSSFDSLPLELADGILWDGYKKDSETFGGTGARSDWGRYRELSRRYPTPKWILAGGLSPENVAEALAATEARVLDFGSSLEIEPGVKDLERLMQLKVSLEEAVL